MFSITSQCTINYYSACKIALFFLLNSVFTLSTAHAQSDEITHVKVPSIIGYEQNVTVYVQVDVKKSRDLHVTIQNTKNWKNEKSILKRIKKSGAYHFEVKMKDQLKPGSYRWNIYLSKKKGGWKNKVSETKSINLIVSEEPQVITKKIKKVVESVTSISFPALIKDNKAVELSVKYKVNAKRDLVLKLQNKSNWQYIGEVVYPIKESGIFTLPVKNMITDFPMGEYRWEVFLAEKENKNKKVSDTLFSSFEVKSLQK